MTTRLGHRVLSEGVLELCKISACETGDAKLALSVAYCERRDIDPDFNACVHDALDITERLLRASRRWLKDLQSELEENRHKVTLSAIQHYARDVHGELALALKVMEQVINECDQEMVNEKLDAAAEKPSDPH